MAAAKLMVMATTVLATLAAWGGTAGPAVGGPAAAAAPDPSASPGERYVVRYSPGTDMRAAGQDLRAAGVEVEDTVTHALDAALVTLDATEARALAQTPGVVSVRPDRTITLAGTQAEPTWGLDRVDQRAMPLSHSFTTPDSASPVEAYVIDTGTAAHDDLAGRVRPGWSSLDGGVGNSDCNGHGTHVAGTVAGTTYGVAKAATIVPVRVLDCGGSGTIFQVVDGIDWAVSQHQPGVPAVANLSLGGQPSPEVDTALRALVADGVAVAVAAGNDGISACLKSPARVGEVLTVAATDSLDQQAFFSNHGPCVDLYAPGVDITSAWNTTPTATATISGTSMASPHVAGAAAVLLSRQPGLTPAQVGDRLVADATVGVVSGVAAETPNRLLFVDQYASTVPPPPPPPPAAVGPTEPGQIDTVRARPKERSVRVAWSTAPDGGSPITAQRIRVYHSGKVVRGKTVEADADHIRVKQLRPGVSYRFTVTLRNAVGRGPESKKSPAVEPRR
jgi:subtilisin family serine protease